MEMIGEGKEKVMVEKLLLHTIHFYDYQIFKRDETMQNGKERKGERISIDDKHEPSNGEMMIKYRIP